MTTPDSARPDLASLRQEYAAGGLVESELAPDPMAMFDQWFTAVRDGGLHEPNAMVLSTVSSAGVPSSRTVLLKGLESDGFRFFTNLDSHKGRDLAANPACSLLFPWHALERQVRIEGQASLLSRADVAAYFSSRPRGSQLGAWASAQSSVVEGREALEASYDEAVRRFADGEVPVPDHWGGYVVRPELVEFWHGRPSRLHDRLVYRRDDSASSPYASGWVVERLAP